MTRTLVLISVNKKSILNTKANLAMFPIGSASKTCRLRSHESKLLTHYVTNLSFRFHFVVCFTLAIFTEILYGFTQSPQNNSVIVPSNIPQSFLSDHTFVRSKDDRSVKATYTKMYSSLTQRIDANFGFS